MNEPTAQAESSAAKLIRLATTNADDLELAKAVSEHVRAALPDDSPITSQYNVLYLFDEGRLVESDADHIYAAAQTLDRDKPVLLILHSPGGEIAPAYFVSKICRQYAKQAFVVAVPRKAKSAATLICCGADAIHMGIVSELGPIDPQIDGMPTLGLKNAIEHLADLVKKNPSASEMFASYLSRSLRLPQLGYYERVAESAVQYGERLLMGRRTPLKKSATEVSRRLVYDYKDHGFVIDANEAEEVFGPGMILRNTPEYHYANAAYRALEISRSFLKYGAKKRMYFVGTVDSGCQLLPLSRTE